MYFIPQKNSRWYTWAAHAGYLRRYGVVLIVLATVFIAWRFTAYAWLSNGIASERAATAQLRQQVEQLAHAERLIKEMNEIIPVLSTKVREYSNANKDERMRQQFSDIMNTIQRSGVTLALYNEERESKKKWGVSQSVQLGINGKFEQILSFLTGLKRSPYLIHCATIQCTRAGGDVFSASCGLHCAVATS